MTRTILRSTMTFTLAVALLGALTGASQGDRSEDTDDSGVVRCASVVYGKGKKSKCFANHFLKQIEQDTHVRTKHEFEEVDLESPDLFEYPFAIMTGEGSFTLTDAQRRNLKAYLEAGGFVVASAGCSSATWNRSFQGEMKKIFPEMALEDLDGNHPVFHTVYDITSSKYKSGKSKLPLLKGLTLDDRVVLIYSPDGLNDTGNAGGNCCCCGGNEVKSAKQLNVNLLAYALTH